MKNMQLILLFIVFLLASTTYTEAQVYGYYVRASSHDFNPSLYFDGTSLKYSGRDLALQALFNNNTIYVFEKEFNFSKRSDLQRTFYVQTNSATSLKEFLQKAPSIFEYGEYLGIEDPELLYFPNDYGITGGSNQGANANLRYLDFIGMPQAWDYTTGSLDIDIGISDGGPLDATDLEFANKTTVLAAEDTDPNGTSHGNNVTAIAAAQGDNAYSGTGVCFDCSILKNGYRSVPGFPGSSFERIIELAEAGARVINCSWVGLGYSESRQNAIDELTEYGIVIIAAAGNQKTGSLPRNELYPASFDNVISVSAVGSGNDLDCNNIASDGSGSYIPNVKNYLTGRTRLVANYDCNQPLENQVSLDLAKTPTLNAKVDIVAPGSGHYRHYQSVMNGTIEYISDTDLWTSPTAPLVTGTVGLMKALNDCLPFNEVVSILKITSTNIDDIPANQIAAGYYGSGTLHTGRAVQLTNNLLRSDSIAYLRNQRFSRWDFIFNGVSESIVMEDQEFTDESTVTVTAKNEIILEDGTFLEPNSNGFAIFEIDSTLVIDTTGCATSPLTSDEKNSEKVEELETYILAPNIVYDLTTISKENKDGDKIVSIRVFNMIGIEMLTIENINEYQVEVDLSRFSTGVYLIKGYDLNDQEIFTKKVIKN